MIQVNLETGNNRRELVALAIDALGDDFIVGCKSANTILIKVNLVHHENQLASTHVDAVRGIIDRIRVHSRAKVFVGDASYHGTKAAFRNFGYDQLVSDYDNIELVDLNDDDFVEGYSIKSDGSRNTIRRSKLVTEVDLKISLAPMKMHRDTGVSLTVKNWTIGTWIVPSRVSASGRVWARWPWLHEEGARAHNLSIMELYRQLPCDFAIIDGIQAMEGDGPTRGTMVPMGIVLSGPDAIAVDAVACSLMGVDPSDIGYLFMCDQEGLGSIDLTHINVPPMQMHNLTRSFARPSDFENVIVAWKN